jgi:dihydrofolate synthase/folylpolyglutamate synthase
VNDERDPVEYLFSLEHFGIKLGLDNIRTILRAAGNPQSAYRTVHVAGTNGKGSVTAIIERVLRQAGLRTGRYTSPHLLHLTERFAIDGNPVSDEELRQVLSMLQRTIESLRARAELDVHPTFFEVTTAAAFVLFERAGVDAAVVEVGLGGRLDATNVLNPGVTAITTIARDHEQYLGERLTDIASEKAGIIKAGVPVVVGRVAAEAFEVISARARAQEAPLVAAPAGVRVEVSSGSGDGIEFTLETPRRDYGRLHLSLNGEHQIDNAIVAVRVVEELESRGWFGGAEPPVVPRAVREALRDVHWPGRLQWLRIAGERQALLDAAHNPAGASALAAFLVRNAVRHPIVFAAMRDKDVAGIVDALAPAVSMFIATRASHPRSHTPDSLAALIARHAPGTAIATAATAAEALELAWSYDPIVIVAGSIFLLGDVVAVLEGRGSLQ